MQIDFEAVGMMIEFQQSDGCPLSGRKAGKLPYASVSHSE